MGRSYSFENANSHTRHNVSARFFMMSLMLFQMDIESQASAPVALACGACRSPASLTAASQSCRRNWNTHRGESDGGHGHWRAMRAAKGDASRAAAFSSTLKDRCYRCIRRNGAWCGASPPWTHLPSSGTLLRFGTRQQAQVWTSPCRRGRTDSRIRCVERSDDILLVRDVKFLGNQPSRQPVHADVSATTASSRGI